MALKFLNKKGWHTGSLRNIENVWKAEQKHDAEQKKLEELRKQIQEERERSEFRLLQQQAGLVPKQERLDFLYDSGLAVGKGNSDGFKTLEALPKPEVDTTSSTKPQPSAPGALFEEKPQSANDAWRKLHSDPLLLIRQREQEALSKIKNNPVQMAMIRKSVEAKKQDKPKDKEHKKDSRKKSKYRKHSPSRGESDSEDDPGRDRHKNTKHGKHSRRGEADYEDAGSDGELRKKRTRPDERNHGDHPSRGRTDSKAKEERRNSKYDKYSRRGESDSEDSGSEGKQRRKRASFDDNNNDEHPSRGRTYQKAEGERRNPKYDTHSRRGEADSEDFGRESKGREKRASVDDNNNGEHPSRGRTYQKAEEERRYSKYDEKHSRRGGADSEDSASEGKQRKKRASVDDNNHGEPPSRGRTYLKAEEETKMRSHQKTTHEKLSTEKNHVPTAGHSQTSRSKPRQGKLSEEERAARLREMELDAKVHEEQRWKRLKKASDMDSLEASQERSLGGRSFLDAAQKSVYGAEKGGSSTIEESVRRRKYFMQGRSEAGEGSAFRR